MIDDRFAIVFTKSERIHWLAMTDSMPILLFGSHEREHALFPEPNTLFPEPNTLGDFR